MDTASRLFRMACWRAVLMIIGIALLSSMATAAPRAPNIVFILVDDLGYSELGCYGQKKIQTPRIDRLASEGMRFTQHYSGNAVCAPSRCVLMTGKHPGHAIVRNNREIQPEGQYPIPAETLTLAELLKQHGYVTGAFGKWGLGGPGTVGEPLKQGFDRFYGYNCQREAHNYYPERLWDNDKIVHLDNPPIRKERLPASADPNSSASYAAYLGKQYSADLIAQKAREFVRQNKDVPFFLFWPTTVPHLALQVPQDSLAQYLGLWPDPPYLGNRGYTPQFAPHAAYAAMVTRFDREVGRLMDLLDELKLAENTIVVFTSDNGPTHDKVGGSDSEFFESADGFRGVKGQLYEGGVRVPLIVRWKNQIAAGKVSDHVTGFEDWIPTLLELTQAGKPPAGLDGISFAPMLRGESLSERPFLYREFQGYGGQQSVRVGDWKLIRRELHPAKKAQPTSQTLELFNLKTDPGETNDLAAAEPSRVERLLRLMRQQHVGSPEFPIRALDGETTATNKE